MLNSIMIINFDPLDPSQYSKLEIIHYLLLQILARVPLKKCFHLAIIVPGKCNLLTQSTLTASYCWLPLVIKTLKYIITFIGYNIYKAET